MTSEDLEMRCDDLYQRLNLPHGRLELMTGIKERRYWDIGTKPSYIATEAAKDALSKTHIKDQEIDFLIHASVCRDFLEPATSSVVHQNLNLKKSMWYF